MSRSDSDVVSAEITAPTPELVVIAPREVPLGGLRAMTVRRTLPNRSRTMIGAWCFLDHYGPDLVTDSGGMSVAPHPHTGLQTVSWLFSGEIEHRDSTGARALVTPGSLNLMTAGRGIQHSEVSTPHTTTLHGVQLWVALPESARHQAPHFDAVEGVTAQLDDASVTVFLGDLAGVGAVDAPTYSPLVGAEITLPPGGQVTLHLNDSFEYGLLVDSGTVATGCGPIPQNHLGVLPTGHTTWDLRAGDTAVRAVLIGGEPLGEEIVMWWNFVGRSQDDIVAARTEWQAGLKSGSTRFGHLDHMTPLPAPEMPHVTLKPRG
jgi:quercetin 2,3-dioxygenase